MPRKTKKTNPKTKEKIAKIKKRDGRLVDFNQAKITTAISKALAAQGNDNRDLAQKLSNKVVQALHKYLQDGVPRVEQIQDVVVETLAKEGYKGVANLYELYRKKRKEIREAKWWLLAQDIRTKLTPSALRVLESRYLKRDENGKIIETPQELFRRVATNIASAESSFNSSLTSEEIFAISEKFYRMMASLDFLPNSPTLMNAGNPLQQLSACFVLPVGDSMEEIFDSVKHTAIIHKTGGGTGFNFSRLRPKGDMVHSTQGCSSGPLSFMTVFNAATNVVTQGGKRRGANMGILNVHHPDILEFITAKTEEGRLSNFNISVAITDKFMQAVKQNKKYELINPRTNQTVRQLSARKVFDLIVSHAWKNGEPGVIFIDRINQSNPTPKLGEIESTNPCGEQPLLALESCNLGSVNLSHMICEAAKSKAIDWEKLKKTVWLAVRFLDNVIEINRYPLLEIERMTKGNRKIGLGVMGFANLLFQLKISYNSKKALILAGRIMKFIHDEGRKASVKLAKERGVFPNFRDSIYNQRGMPRLRNATITTIAPTGSIGVIAGCSPSIEPEFALAYRKLTFTNRDSLEGEYLTITNPYFEGVAKERKFWSKKLVEEVAEKGSVQDIGGIPTDVKRVFVTALDVAPENHIKMQAAFQKHIDNATSKTINFPFSASEDDVRKAYLLAHRLGCKGVTLYRNDSRKQQALNIGKAEKQEKGTEDEREKMKRKRREEFPELPPNSCPTCHT